MTIESSLARIADALEKATTAAPVIVTHHDDTKAPSPTLEKVPEPEPAQAPTMEPDHEEPAPPPTDEFTEDRALLAKAIPQLCSVEGGTDKARAILLEFHGAEKISDLNSNEWASVATKMNAAYLALDS